MNIIWKYGCISVSEILTFIPGSKPHYNTISTTARILVQKTFLSYKISGRLHIYFALIPKIEYREFLMSNLINKYFNNNPSDMMEYLLKK